MKIFGLVASLLVTLNLIGQKSYYFSDPLPSNEKLTMAVDSKWFGTYLSKNTARSYEILIDGIYVVSTSISSISRELIREATQYDVRDNYIFGVLADDSIPCVLEGDRYYFGIKNRDLLIGHGSKNKLTRIGPNEYIINYYENGYYIPKILSFERGSLSLKDFNYEFETRAFDFIEVKKTIPTEYHELVVLTPSEAEYDLMLNENIFPTTIVFKKQK